MGDTAYKRDATEQKFRTRTGEVYRYPDARVTSSAVWGCCIFLIRGALEIGAHNVARDPIMGNVEPMKPAVEGVRPGRREQGDVRVSKGQGLTAYR
jgi:hypothetical protein